MNEMIHANTQFFADDTSLYLIVEHLGVTAQLSNKDIGTLAKAVAGHF